MLAVPPNALLHGLGRRRLRKCFLLSFICYILIASLLRSTFLEQAMEGRGAMASRMAVDRNRKKFVHTLPSR